MPFSFYAADIQVICDIRNKLVVVICNGTPYSYVKNLQGDIVAILDSNNAAVVNYVYDAWGRPISCSGTMANTLGKINPFRYRGYVYDEENGMYYLRSRYYHSGNGCFIAADNLLIATACGDLNLYYYCRNNPVIYTDANGTYPNKSSYVAAWNTHLYENADSSLSPIIFNLKLGTHCEVEKEVGGFYYVKVYMNGKYQQGYIQKDCLDLSPSYSVNQTNDYFDLEKISQGKFYHEGSYGPQILLLNMCLNRYFDTIEGVSEGQLPCTRIPITKQYTFETKLHVEKFQEQMGIDVDGFVGIDTLIKLQEWLKNENGKG